MTERRFTDAGRTDEAQDRRLRFRIELHHRKAFENTVLHVLEAEVIFVEHALRVLEIEAVLGARMPGQLGDELEIAARDLVVRRVRRHPCKALELAIRFLLDDLGQVRFRELLSELGDLFFAAFLFAQRVLDRALLLTKQMLALLLFDVLLRLFRDLAAQLVDVELVLQDVVQPFEQRDRVGRFEHALLACDVEVGERRHPVHLRDRIADRADELLKDLRAVFGVEEHRDSLRDVQIFAHERGDPTRLGGLVGDGQLRQYLVAHFEMRLADHLFEQPHALGALHDHLCAALAALHALDHDERADVVHLVAARRFLLAVLLRDSDQRLLRARGCLDGGERLRPAHGERDHEVGIHDRVLERQDGQGWRILCHRFGSPISSEWVTSNLGPAVGHFNLRPSSQHRTMRPRGGVVGAPNARTSSVSDARGLARRHAQPAAMSPCSRAASSRSRSGEPSNWRFAPMRLNQ